MKHGLNFASIDASLVNFNHKSAHSHDVYETMNIDIQLVYCEEGYFKIITSDCDVFLTTEQLKLEWITYQEMQEKHSVRLTDEQAQAVENAPFDKVCEFYPQLKGKSFAIKNGSLVIYPKNTTFE